MRRPFKILAIAALALSLPVAAAVAAEIKLMCPAPMRTTIVELVAQFERASPHKVTIVHTPSRMIIERIQGGEAFDVSILTAEATNALIKQGKVARRIDIARSSIGLGVRAGTPKPDVSSAEAVKRALLAAKSASPRATSSATYPVLTGIALVFPFICSVMPSRSNTASMCLPLSAPSLRAKDFDASRARFTASAELTSGFGVPARTPSPMLDRAISTRRATLPCLTSASVASAVRIETSKASPP